MTFPLGSSEESIGRGNEFVRRFGILGPTSDPCAQSKTGTGADGVGRTLDQQPRRGAVGQPDQNEFVSSVTPQDIALTKGARQGLRGLAENAVSLDMTLVVVDGLESVQIDENGK